MMQLNPPPGRSTLAFSKDGVVHREAVVRSNPVSPLEPTATSIPPLSSVPRKADPIDVFLSRLRLS